MNAKKNRVKDKYPEFDNSMAQRIVDEAMVSIMGMKVIVYNPFPGQTSAS